MAQSLAQARVVDPVLTTVARGYRNAMFAFQLLFPIVTVMQRGGKIITFGAEDFTKLDIIRAPGADRQRLQVGYAGGDYALTQRAIDGQLAREHKEEAAAVPGIDMGKRTAMQSMKTVFLQIEVAAAALATTPGNYQASNKATLAGASQWSHADSLPAKKVEQCKESVADGIGIDPNVMVMGPDVFRALKNNPDVIDRIKYTAGPGGGAMVTEATLAAYFDVEKVVVARARSGEPGAFSPLWGKDVVLAYSNMSSLKEAESGAGEPSFGYTYRLNKYPMVEAAYFDKRCDSWLYPVTTEDTPVIAGQNAGYLLSAAVA